MHFAETHELLVLARRNRFLFRERLSRFCFNDYLGMSVQERFQGCMRGLPSCRLPRKTNQISEVLKM